MSTCNQYERKSRKKSFLGGITEAQDTKGDLKASAIETGKDLLIGVIGGGVIGAAIGRPSLLVGIAASFYGNFTENRLITALGFGMMASNGFKTKQGGVSGTDVGGLEGAKERVMEFKDSFKDKLYLDKILKKKAETTEGMGDVQYFTYPESERLGAGNIDMSALDHLERQIEASAGNFQSAQSNLISGLAGGIGDDFETVNY